MEGSQHKEHRDRWQNRSTPLPYLRELRRSRAMTQRELSECAGVSVTTVRLLEGGRRGCYPTTMRKLAKALGVAPAELTLEHRPDRQEHIGR